MASLGIDIGGSSVKVALHDGAVIQTARSASYQRPDREALASAIRDAMGSLDTPIDSSICVGLCLPGRHDKAGSAIECSFNLPCLEGWAFGALLRSALGFDPARWRVVSDVHAATMDIVRSKGLDGRVAVVAIGTGVGLGVWEHGQMCTIGSRGIGHLGQIDVGRLGDEDQVAPSGAINTLESYIGLPALRARLGCRDEQELVRLIASLPPEGPTMRALVAGLRVFHAIYVPDTVVLAGGVGLAMRGSGGAIHARVSDGLTTLANPDWSLLFADSLFHAASGAATLALG
ncbi:MAG: ROK family protein [Phycisphaerales bacterium JB052]